MKSVWMTLKHGGSHDGRINTVHHNVVFDFKLQFDVLGIFIVSIEGLVMRKLAYGANCKYQYIYILSHFVWLHFPNKMVVF